MNNWQIYSLAELADIRISNVDKKSKPGENSVLLCNYMNVYPNDYITANLTFMESTASSVEHTKFKVDKGDVLITKDSETPYDIGIPSVVIDEIEDLVCGYHLALIKPNRGIVNPVFLSKQLATATVSSYFSRMAAGSTRYGLSNGAIARTRVSLPSLEKQYKIAKILQTIDRTITHTEALIEKYQQIKAGLMHDLFTRGIGADGKLRPPRDQAPEMYRESSIGWIPKEWKTKPIGKVFSIQLGKMLSPLAKTGKFEYSYLNNRSVHWDKVNIEGLSSMDFNTKEREKFKLIYGDLLVCEGGDVGRTAIWRDDLENCYFQKTIHRLRSLDGQVLPEFMLRFMMYAKNTGMFSNFTSQTSIAHLTREKLLTVSVFVPPVTEQEQLVKRFDSIDQNISVEVTSLDKLKKQKSGLMYDLLTGKVQVNNEEIT
jgi:type I restriction enzyme, S subunit